MFKKPFNKFIARLVFIFAISFSIAGLVIYFSVQESLSGIVRELNAWLLALGFSMMALSWIIDGLRIRNLACATGTPMGLWTATRIQLISEFTSALTPSGMGGGPLKIYLIQRKGATLGSATAIFSVDKILDILFLNQ